MFSRLIVSGTLAETPAPNQYGYYNLRIQHQVAPNHPYIKGEQWAEIEASIKNPAAKLLEKMTKGTAVEIVAEQYRDHYTDKTGTPRTYIKNRLLSIDYAPLSRSRQHQMQELQQAATEAPAEQGRAYQPTPHQQAKQNAYQPSHESDADIPF
jgi:single-stranded DNA-binding protein